MNDSSKRHSQFLSLIFILNCLSKASVIKIPYLHFYKIPFQTFVANIFTFDFVQIYFSHRALTLLASSSREILNFQKFSWASVLLFKSGLKVQRNCRMIRFVRMKNFAHLNCRALRRLERNLIYTVSCETYFFKCTIREEGI